MIAAWVAFLTLAHAAPHPTGCTDQQVSAWLRASLKPVLQRATQILATQRPAISPDLRLAFTRQVRACDERAHGAARQALTRQIEEHDASLAQELKALGEALPRALEKCAGPSREACLGDVRRAYALREHALAAGREANRADLVRQRDALGLSFEDAYRIVGTFDILDAYAKGFVAKMGVRPNLTLHAITITDGDEFGASWKVAMDVRYADQNFDYLTRVYLNLYQRVTKATLAQVSRLAVDQGVPTPERVATINGNSLEGALADHRSGRDVTWLASEADGSGQIGVLDTVTVKTLRAELRP